MDIDGKLVINKKWINYELITNWITNWLRIELRINYELNYELNYKLNYELILKWLRINIEMITN